MDVIEFVRLLLHICDENRNARASHSTYRNTRVFEALRAFGALHFQAFFERESGSVDRKD